MLEACLVFVKTERLVSIRKTLKLASTELLNDLLITEK